MKAKMNVNNGIIVIKIGKKYYVKDVYISMSFVDSYINDTKKSIKKGTKLVFTNRTDAVIKALGLVKKRYYKYGVQELIIAD